MPTAKDLSDYGGVKANAEPVADPETQLDADEWNEMAEDTAHLTRGPVLATVKFTTTSVAHPVVYAASAVQIKSVWGNGTAQKPTVTKTAQGLYTITFAASFTNALGVVENVSFFSAIPKIIHNDSVDDMRAEVYTLAANVGTFGFKETGVGLTDVGVNVAANFEVTVTFT